MTSDRRRLLRTGSVLLVVLVLLFAFVWSVIKPPQVGSPAGKSARTRPNILFVVIDDMGFNDLGANGNAGVKTPNLDQLASQGVRFTRNYVDSTCTVTRAGMLTGVDPSVNGFRPDALGISPEVMTLPESLRAAGYSTHHIGKWHLGYLSRLAWPTEQGFDTFFGFLAQHLLRGPRNGEWVFGTPTYRNPWLQHGAEWPTRHPGHLSEILTDHASNFIKSLAGAEQPWFLAIWTYAPHAPVDPMEKFASRYPDTPQGKYLAFIEQVDDTVGRILQSLDESGLADNTLVFVVSDNGGTNREVENNLPFRGEKSSFFEGGVRTPLLVRWPGKLKPGLVFDGVVSYLDYFPTFATAAGAPIPEGVNGRDLLDVVENGAQLNGNLYWEASNSLKHSWSVLSRDGRWRLGQYVIYPPELNDLVGHPAGDQNVLESNPQVADKLRQDYLTWRMKNREIKLDYEALGDNGRARLSGNSLQRAPGYQGQTFAIAVTPQLPGAHGRAAAASEKQFIAYQRNLWQLFQRGPRLHLELNGIELEAPALEPNTCSTVMVTSQFNPGHVWPKSRQSMVELYVNGKQLAQFKSGSYQVPVDDYLNPTFIGQDEHGTGVYLGNLGKPVMLNERLVPEELNDGKIENGILAVESKLCGPQT
jgi:arylsulfatase A-like enzyme